MHPPDLPFSAAAERNQGPILALLRRALPARATVLEIASGTGQHAAHFAAAEPGWTWQPSERDAAALPAIAARCAGLPNVPPPLQLDLLALPAAPGRFDAAYCANLLHIAPWPVCAALMRAAANLLQAGGLLVVYGPFVVDGEPTAPSNLAFDADLRARDPAWGLRRLADVVDAARAEDLAFEQRFAMPANNLTLQFRRGAVDAHNARH